MRSLLLIPIALLTACGSAGTQQAPPPAPAPQAAAAPVGADGVDTRPGLAVFPFYSGGSIGRGREDLDALEIGIQQMLLTELAQNPSLRVVERNALRELLAEQDLGATGRVDANTAARLGRLVGARYVVLGGFTDISGNFRLDGRVVDVETSEVLRAQQVTGRRNQIFNLVFQLSSRLTADVNLPPLASNVQAERSRRSVPDEAVVLYSRALMLQDHGQTDRAIELYRQITQQFPQMTEAREALRQLSDA